MFSVLQKLILLPFTVTPLALALNTLANLYLAYRSVQYNTVQYSTVQYSTVLTNLYLPYSGHIPDQEQFFSLDNIHNCLKIPFFVTMMYRSAATYCEECC